MAYGGASLRLTVLSDAHLTDAMSAANRVFAYSRLSDYTPIKREGIARRRLFVSFQTELSSVKVTCFMALYRSLPMPPTTPRLDVIVLTNDAPYSRLSPPTTLLKIEYPGSILSSVRENSTVSPAQRRVALMMQTPGETFESEVGPPYLQPSSAVAATARRQFWL